MLFEEFDDLADVLGFIAIENEEGVGGVDDDQILDAQHRHEFAWRVHVVARALGEDRFAAAGVAFGIVLMKIVDGIPGADVVPAEFGGRDAEDAGLFFEYGVVDRDVFAEGENAAKFGEEFRAQEGREALDEFCGFGEMPVECVQQAGGFPEEHAGVPAVIAGLQEFFCGGQVWLFAEAGDGNRVEGAEGCLLGEFDVAVARFGIAGFDAKDNHFALGGGAEGGPDSAQVDGRPRDDVVCREDAENRTGVERMEHVAGKSDGGGRVALSRLGDDLAFGDFWKLARDLILEEFVGEDPDALRGQ